MKFAVWILFILLLLWLMRGNKKSAAARSAASASANASRNGAETMVRCVHCGVHLPASEAVTTAAGASFCSEEHRLRHAA